MTTILLKTDGYFQRDMLEEAIRQACESTDRIYTFERVKDNVLGHRWYVDHDASRWPILISSHDNEGKIFMSAKEQKNMLYLRIVELQDKDAISAMKVFCLMLEEHLPGKRYDMQELLHFPANIELSEVIRPDWLGVCVASAAEAHQLNYEFISGLIIISDGTSALLTVTQLETHVHVAVNNEELVALPFLEDLCKRLNGVLTWTDP